LELLTVLTSYHWIATVKKKTKMKVK